MTKTQDRVIAFLDKYGSITQRQANYYLGISRLAAVICELKKNGVSIMSEYILVDNRFGEPCRVKRYFYAPNS